MFDSIPLRSLLIDIILISLLTVCISYGFARGTLAASRGESIATVFVYALVAWGGYLLAHYYATGQFIDPGSVTREFELPDRTEYRVAIAGGSCLLVVAVPVGIYGMHLDSLLVTGSGVTTFLTGYYITHYAMSGDML